LIETYQLLVYLAENTEAKGETI